MQRNYNITRPITVQEFSKMPIGTPIQRGQSSPSDPRKLAKFAGCLNGGNAYRTRTNQAKFPNEIIMCETGIWFFTNEKDAEISGRNPESPTKEEKYDMIMRTVARWNWNGNEATRTEIERIREL